MMEQRIRDLCAQLMNAKDPDEMEDIGERLRTTIHDHVEELRREIKVLPVLDAKSAA